MVHATCDVLSAISPFHLYFLSLSTPSSPSTVMSKTDIVTYPTNVREITYHPNYNQGMLWETTFTTIDGTGFWFDWELLGFFSPFFEEYRAKFPPVMNKRDALSLPGATTRALAFTFDVIQSTANGTFNPWFFKIDGDDEFMDEVITLAKSFDLRIALSSLLMIKKAAGVDILIIYTLATLAGDTKESESHSDAIITRGVHSLPPWTTKTLKQRKPLALVRLYELGPMWAYFKTTLVSSLTGYRFSQTFCNINTNCLTRGVIKVPLDNFVPGLFLTFVNTVTKPSSLKGYGEFCKNQTQCNACTSQLQAALREYIQHVLAKSRSNFGITL